MSECIAFLNAAGGAFVRFAVPMLIQSSIVIVAVLVLDLLLRRRIKAVVRYGIWLLVLVKLLLPPSLAAPTSLVYWIGARLPSLPSQTETVISEPTVAPPAISVAEQPVAMAQPQFVPPVEQSAPAFAPPSPVATVAAKPVAFVPPPPPITWQAMAFLAWLLVVVVMTLLLIQRAFFVRGLVAQSEEAPEAMVDQLEQCRRQMGVRSFVVLRLTSLSASPSVCGLWKPRILMPQGMTAQLDTRQFKSILLHELAHVKRADLWINLVQAMLQIVYFFHPLLWLANWMIRRVREQAVDETVLAAMGKEAEDYPRTLLNVSKLAFGRPALSLRLIGVVESKKALTARTKHIASRPFPKTAKLGLAGLVLVTTLAAVLLPMAKAEPGDDDTTASEAVADEFDNMRTIQGVVTDTLGRPRQCVHIAPQGTRVWDGVMSDVQGRFVLEDVKPEQKVWIAWSQASRLYGFFRVPQRGSSPLKVTLDLDEADLSGRVVGADGKPLAEREVELVVTIADGIRFPLTHRPKTDAFGYYSHSSVPCGAGVSFEVRVLDDNTPTESYSTESVEARAGQTFVEMPVLVAAAKKVQPDFDRNLRNDGMLHCRGRVVDEEDKPIAGVRVGLHFDMAGWMATWSRDAMTDDQGHWHRAIPPQAMDLSVDFEHPEYYVDSNRNRPSRDELEKGTHRTTMKRGLTLTGNILDKQGQPVKNALVCADRFYSRTPGPYNQIIENSTTDRTLGDGTFCIRGLPPGRTDVTVYSDHHAPAVETVDIQGGQTAMMVALHLGNTYRGRIVNAHGEPLEGARVGVYTWRLGKDRRSLTRLVSTDAQGRFALANLPEGQIELNFKMKPYMGFYKDLPEDLSQIDRIVMYEVPLFSGSVVDAETNAPIPEFTIVNGIKRKHEDGAFDWSRYHRNNVKDPNGVFSHRWRGYGISYPLSSLAAIKFEAQGYLPTIAPPQELDRECEPLTIRLRRGTPIRGTIRKPDGGGASEAQIALVKPGEKAYIDRDQFSAASFAHQVENVEKADENGAFELAPCETPGLIVAVHNSGYTQIPSKAFANGSDLTLTAWSRVEGVIDRSRIEDEEVEIILYGLEPDADRGVPSIDWLFSRISVTGDTFAQEFVPAIPLAVGRFTRYELNDGAYFAPEPGRTYSVAIGARGRAVTGRILFSQDVLKAKSIALTDPRQAHAVAFSLDESSAMPPKIAALEENSFRWFWRDKEHVYALSQVVKKRFVPRIAEDGTFTFPGLEPGQYEFVVNIHAPLGENVSCGRGVLEGVAVARFTVLQGGGNTPLRVPDIQVRRLTYPGSGEPAPLFEAKTFDGQTVRLEELRGKVVLLDFWASWCSPCVAELPKMHALHEAFADRKDFAMIGLSLDWDVEKAKRMIDEKQLGWAQACLGSMDESVVVRQYGVGEIPMTILIDAQGTILARGADAKELKPMIEKALGNIR